MRLFNIGICLALAVAFLACALPVIALGSTFSVSGQVIDRYGDPVQGANVTLIDFSYKTIGIRQSGENGNYDFINVNSDTDTVTVRVNITKDGKAYEVPSYYTRWYPARGLSYINNSETMFPDYPAPTYGYVYGAIQAGTSASDRFIDGVVYLTADGVTYYEFAESTDGKGSFMFYALPGLYVLYAQHREYGAIYESAPRQVTIQPNGDVSEVLETRIALPLGSPAESPYPAAMPSRHENRIGGTVTDEGGKPIASAMVTLYQATDNGTGFIPMRGADSKPLTAVTDINGRYEFIGASPTTDDGKTIHTKKSIKAFVEYRPTENVTISAWTGENVLYYPDVLLGNGLEGEARNVTLSGALSPDDVVQPTVSVSDAPPAASDIAAVPLMAALAIGLVCIAGLYVIFNRKG